MKISLPSQGLRPTQRTRTAHALGGQAAQSARVQAQLRRHVPVLPPAGAQSHPADGLELRRAITDSPHSEGILWWRLGSHPWWRLP